MAEKKPAAKNVDPLAAVLAAIAEMEQPDRAMAERIHELVTNAAPELAPRLFYGMPGYFKDGKQVCFFQSGIKFKTRYCTFGFQPAAQLDDGNMWPVAFAVTELDAETEARIVELVKKAVG